MTLISQRSRTAVFAIALAISAAQGSSALDEWPEVLDGTKPLTLDEPLDVVMVRGISRFAEQELAKSPERRRATWPGGGPTTEAYRDYVRKQRTRLREILGVDEEMRTINPRLLITAGQEGSDLLGTTAEAPRVHMVQWEVMDGMTGEGLLLVPAGETAGYAVAVPDATWTPEMFCGLAEGVPATAQLPRRLVEQGIVVLVPMLISRDDWYAQAHPVRSTNIPNREFVYRMGFQMGAHLIGCEVQKVLAAMDVLGRVREGNGGGPHLGLCGVGDGGQVALFAAALYEKSLPTLVCGYFAEREQVWQQPIDRNIWSQLTTLGDAEIAALAADDSLLLIEASATPAYDSPGPASDGQRDFAAPGTIRTAPLDSVRREFARLQQLTGSQGVQLIETKEGADPAGSSDAFEKFASAVTDGDGSARNDQPLALPAATTAPRDRERRQMDELVRFIQRLLHRSDKVRSEFWSEADDSSVEAWVDSAEMYRQHIHDEMIGRLPLPVADLDPRTRQVIDEPTHIGYEILLDVLPAESADEVGVIAGGILLLPKDLKEGERRPVVVCQHGLEGTPMDTITTDESLRAWRAYKGFSTQLVKRGFIVYAPQNPYRGLHDFRVIQRKSNPLGRSLFSYIIEQHRQTLRWLATLPWVDVDRIAFYGLSYGGKTAVRVPPLLTAGDDGGHPEYCLSICSADFNEWIRKNVSSEDRYSYVFTREYEMFEWNMGHVAGYAELASLMVPRPFMVERGHDDGVAPDEWVAWEYAKVRRLYDKLGIGERTEIEFFNGPHTINGQGTYEFLHRHLNWPESQGAVR